MIKEIISVKTVLEDKTIYNLLNENENIELVLVYFYTTSILSPSVSILRMDKEIIYEHSSGLSKDYVRVQKQNIEEFIIGCEIYINGLNTDILILQIDDKDYNVINNMKDKLKYLAEKYINMLRLLI